MSSHDDFIKSICRICLEFYSSEKMVSLIDNSDKNGQSVYAKAVLCFADIVIEKQDNMPTFMCLNCLYLLKQAISFKMKCESSDKCLKNIANKASSTTIFKENLVDYTMFKSYLPEELIKDTSKKRLTANNIKPVCKKMKNTQVVHTQTNTIQTNTIDKTSTYNAKVDCLLNQLDLQFTSKKENLKVIKQINNGTSIDSFDNLNIPIESTNNTSKRKNSASSVNSKNKKIKNSFNNTATPNPKHEINLSVDCLLDKLEIQFASTIKDINVADEMRNMMTEHNMADKVYKGCNIEPDSKNQLKGKTMIDIKNKIFEPNSLDYTATNDPDDDSNISVDCLLDKLETQFASTSKKLPADKKQIKNILHEESGMDSSNNTADFILNKLQSKFASKYSMNNIDSGKPLKKKKLKISKMYREKRKKLQERKKVLQNKLLLVCSICDKVLANRHTYEQHMQRHTGCRYICEHCGKGFPVLYELQTHQVSQHGTGPHLKCSQCPFKAARKFDLVEHVRIHSGERPYTCDKCGLTFRRRGIWRKHLIYHMEKTVQCPHCPRKFFQRSEMLAHANNIHDRVYVYLCNKCGATYAKSATVRRHMAERHGIPKELQGKVIRINKGSSYNEQ